ncbi:MAG: ferrous iron transporter B [Epulopiscium sp. Nuni2H_MBin001]|nr:MAG: ferrous iron transporter B [Epulopiscium sp. Nuni2H_MBin001]
MSGHCNIVEDKKVYDLPNKILLMGNPNVGKSVIFSALTGVHVMSSNYAGTTVSYTKAKIKLGVQEYQLIDVPGTYSLTPTSEAEIVASSFMNSGAKAVICVLDATNLTRNLNLAFEIMAYNIPVVFALNLIDIAKRKGMIINQKVLEKELGAPVINTVAVKGEGLEELKDKLTGIIESKANPESCARKCADCKTQHVELQKSQKEIWQKSEQITKKCVTSSDENLKFIDKLGQKMVNPMPGIPIALLIIIVSLGLIVGGGKALRTVFFLPLVNGLIVPFFVNIISGFGLPELINNILIGEYGIFVIGFEWPFALLLPYVMLFYIVFTFLEDCGVMPRMAILFDGIMSKMGVQGGSLISLMMGYGCAVPAIIGTRNATTRKERIIITAMVCFAVPCISQSAALISLLASQSIILLIAMFLLSFLVIYIVGLVTGRLIEGKVEPIIIEVPNLLIPEKKAYFKKLLIRLKEFLVEAEGPMIIAIVIAAIFKETGLLDIMANALEPLLSGLLGLPKEAVIFLLLGIIRREMAVIPLLSMELTMLQIFVGGVVSLLYLPCVSVFGVISKELGTKIAVMIGVGTFTTAMLIGTIINFIGQIIF